MKLKNYFLVIGFCLLFSCSNFPKLKGKWLIEKLEINKTILPINNEKEGSIEFDGDKCVFRSFGNKENFKFTVTEKLFTLHSITNPQKKIDSFLIEQLDSAYFIYHTLHAANDMKVCLRKMN